MRRKKKEKKRQYYKPVTVPTCPPKGKPWEGGSERDESSGV